MIDEFDPPKNKKKYDFSSQELLPSQKKKKRKLLQSVYNFEIPSNLDKTLCFKLLSVVKNDQY